MAAGVIGTTPELAVYGALMRLGLKPGVDFEFQSAEFGGRLMKGGLVADFKIFLPRIVINVQGLYWHSSPERQSQDRVQRAMLEGDGWTVVWIDEDDALRDATYYVREAMRGISHSQLMQG